MTGKADAVSLVHAVQVPRRPVSRLEPVIGTQRYEQLTRTAGQVRPVLGGRTIWNINSTAAGGGVAEMLQVLVGYVQDLGISIGWLVITGDAGFFAITKRLHNQIHGSLSGAPLGAAEASHYAQMLAANAVELAAWVRPGDVVLLHDPQTAALAAPLARAGARVVWRCHIGVDWEDEVTRAAWEFLRPHLTAAEAYVFSRRDYIPAWIPAGKAWIIPPSIDPFSPKNQPLAADTVRAILARLGVLDDAAPMVPATFVRRDGDAQSWLANGNLTVARNVADWEKRDLTDIPATRLRSVTLTGRDGKVLKVAKEQSGDANFKVADVPKGREASSEFVANGLGSTLAGLKADDAFPAHDAAPADKTIKAEYAAFDGLVVEATGWDRDGKDYAQFSARLDGAAANAEIDRSQAKAKAEYDVAVAAAQSKKTADEKAGADKAADGKPTPDVAKPASVSDPAKDRQDKLDALNKEVADLNRTFSGWSFVLPSYKFTDMSKTMDDMLKPLETKKPEAKDATKSGAKTQPRPATPAQ